MLSVEKSARILIIGQASGIRVHETGIPWNDKSGDRLRIWKDATNDVFHHVPPHWHARILHYLPKLELTLLVGRYVKKIYLKNMCRKSMTETFRAWNTYKSNPAPQLAQY